MPYVRRRGSQVAIVHGEREPGTGKVRQRILFTIYSKAEALEALGRRKKSPGQRGGKEWFRHLLQEEYPDIRFNWKTIDKGIADHMDALPDLYEYRGERMLGRFRKDLCTFARQLILCDPQELASAARAIEEHRHELEYVADLIEWRLKLCEPKESPWTADNPFFWGMALRGASVPPETEEQAAGYYERGEYDRAEVVFRLLVDCFEGYAEGWNYLGLIALDQDRLEDAIARFEKTIEVGRRLFPARIPKRRYWSDHATRPYMRGLGNLALTLNRVGRYDAALELCDRLETECGDDITASSHRSAIFMNTARWREAAEAAQHISGLNVDQAFVVALATSERGMHGEALAPFLHAAIRYPRTARMLAGVRTGMPKDHEAVEDHNVGVSVLRDLHDYFAHQKRSTKRFFGNLVRDPRVVEILDEAEGVVRRRREQHPTGSREAFDRMTEMQSPEFARLQAAKLRDLVGGPALGDAPGPGERRPRPRKRARSASTRQSPV